MASGRRVVEKTRGDKTARIFQGEGYWTVTLSRPSIGEVARQSARTLAAAKTLGTKLLKAR